MHKQLRLIGSAAWLPLLIVLLALPAAVHSATAEVQNRSVSTLCAEEDNVNIALTSEARCYLLEATHPGIGYGPCPPDFTNCHFPPQAAFEYDIDVADSYYQERDIVKCGCRAFGDDCKEGQSPKFCAQTWQDDKTALEIVREAAFWLEHAAMAVSVDGKKPERGHYLRIRHKLRGRSEWPEILVLYSDGNLRLKPQRLPGGPDPCFGTSVIVGPALPNKGRPYARILAVDYHSQQNQLHLRYADGSTAVLSIQRGDPALTAVAVTVRTESKHPIATLRSMYVSDDNADATEVVWTDANGAGAIANVLTFEADTVASLKLSRSRPSRHNPTAPDVQVDFGYSCEQ